MCFILSATQERQIMTDPNKQDLYHVIDLLLAQAQTTGEGEDHNNTEDHLEGLAETMLKS